MRLTSGGNLLIGTTTLTGSSKLQVNGDITLPLNNNIRFGTQLALQKESNGEFNFYGGTNSTNGGFDFKTWTGSAYTTSFLIRNSGNVLIGTTTDSGNKLEVAGGIRQTANNPILIINNQGSSQTGTLYFRDAFGGASIAGRIQTAGGALGLRTATTGDDNLVILSNGDVGIGTTSPASTLNISGGTGSLSTGLTFGDGDTGIWEAPDDNLRFSTGSSTRMLITDGGNLLIGTTTDDGSSKLQIDGDVKFFGDTSGRDMLWDASLDSLLISSEARLRLGGTNDFWIYHDGTDSQIINRGSGDLIISGHVANGDIRLINQAGGGASNYIVLDSSQETVNIYQNTLIGTTTDSAKLTVDETTTNNLTVAHFKHNQGGVTSNLLLENSAGADDTGFSFDFRLASSGTSAKIGAIRTNSPGAGDTDMFFSTSTNGTSVAEAMRITHNGSVGIGTASPSAAYKLEVNGKAKAQSVELTNVLTLNAISTPANPADGQASIYMDSSDGAIKVKINVGGTVVTRTLALYEG